MLLNEKYYLITTNEWFIAPDGEQYRAVWGKCFLKETKDVFGFVPLRPSTNWYCEVGEGENSMIVAGCQINYAVKCDKRPVFKPDTFIAQETQLKEKINRIYFTE